VNYKLLSLLVNPGIKGHGKNTLQQEMLNAVACPRHKDRPIAYFCKSCNITVCVDCIFDLHNGHLLLNITEMCKFGPNTAAKSVKQNISDLSKMMMNTRRASSDNLTLLS
jgi:hypothetical protein